MLLKGASLATRYYPAPATRPMADVDLLVPHRDAERALGALEREGWRAAKRLPQRLLADHAHGMALVRDQANLDLHWNALWPQRRADSDDLFWGRATRAEFQGRAVHRLDPSDELFHACMHGRAAARTRTAGHRHRWSAGVVDAFMIARSAIDWERIAALAERFHARLQLLDAFGYLRASLGFPVPGTLAGRVGADTRAGRRIALRAGARPAFAPVFPRVAALPVLGQLPDEDLDRRRGRRRRTGYRMEAPRRVPFVRSRLRQGGPGRAGPHRHSRRTGAQALPPALAPATLTDANRSAQRPPSSRSFFPACRPSVCPLANAQPRDGVSGAGPPAVAGRDEARHGLSVPGDLDLGPFRDFVEEGGEVRLRFEGADPFRGSGCSTGQPTGRLAFLP